LTPAHLIEELAAAIREALSEVKMPLEYMKEAADFVAVNVFCNYLPENLFENTSYYPCVVVELVGVEDDLKTDSTIEVALSIGTFALEDDGWKDAWHILELIRNRLLSRRVLAKKFRLKEMKWEAPTEQPREFYFLLGELKYAAYLTQEAFVC